VSPDGLVYEFVLRRGARFHNGEPVRAEDVKFSFERYRGMEHKARPILEAVAVTIPIFPVRRMIVLQASLTSWSPAPAPTILP